MKTTNIHQAKTQLSRLIEDAIGGEDVVISKAGKPIVRLVPIQSGGKPRKGGQWKGRVKIAPDFDQLPPDIASAFGLEQK
jgi:prevent-host-death family protein